jgi:branched-chain amino acid transport system permease protein
MNMNRTPSHQRKIQDALRRESLLGLLGVLAFIAFVGGQAYRQDLGILVIVYALLALGMYLPLALGGRLSLAYNAYFAIGAYSVAVVGQQGVGLLWLAPFIGVGLSMLTAAILAIATRKLSGFHLAVATMMFGIVAYTWLIHSGDWVGGPEGIGGIPRLSILGWELGRTELIVVGALLVWVVATAIARFRVSFFGIALRAQRETVPAAQASGIPVVSLRIIALALGAGIASIAGMLLALMNQFILPESFGIKVVFLVLFMPILGGMFTPWGSVLGALIVVFFTLGFDFFEGPGVLTFGLLALFILLAFPQGVLGGLSAVVRRIAKSRAAARGA